MNHTFTEWPGMNSIFSKVSGEHNFHLKRKGSEVWCKRRCHAHQWQLSRILRQKSRVYLEGFGVQQEKSFFRIKLRRSPNHFLQTLRLQSCSLRRNQHDCDSANDVVQLSWRAMDQSSPSRMGDGCSGLTHSPKNKLTIIKQYLHCMINKAMVASSVNHYE